MVEPAALLRPVTPADRDRVVALMVDWAHEGGWFDLPGPARQAPEGTGVAWSVGDYRGWIEPDWDQLIDVPEWAFVAAVAPDGDALLGFVRGKVVSATEKLLGPMPDGGELFEVTELYVVPEWRGRGVGSELLGHVLGEASARGLHRATLVSATANPDDVVRFYRRHGFEPWWIEMVRNVSPRPPR